MHEKYFQISALQKNWTTSVSTNLLSYILKIDVSIHILWIEVKFWDLILLCFFCEVVKLKSVSSDFCFRHKLSYIFRSGVKKTYIFHIIGTIKTYFDELCMPIELSGMIDLISVNNSPQFSLVASIPLILVYFFWTWLMSLPLHHAYL